MTRSISCLLLALFYSVAVQAQLQFKTPGAVLLQNPIGGAYSPTLRDGELELFFESAGDLYRAQRSSSDILFPTVLRVDELSTTTFIEENPFLSVDGLRLYFTRRSRTSQNRDILAASRENFTSPFGAPGAVGPVTNPPFRGRLGSLTGDELKIYLEIPRTIPPGSGTPLTEHTDIAAATRENTTQRFGMWQFLPHVNTLDYERSPSISRDDLVLGFSRVGPLSNLPGTLFFSARENPAHPFPAGEAAAGVVSGNKALSDPFLVYPGTRLYFSRDDTLWAADREIHASYRLPRISGYPGRSAYYPIEVSTTEADARSFEFKLIFDSLFLQYLQVLPSSELGIESITITPEATGRIAIQVSTQSALPDDGLPHTILFFRFLISENAFPGQVRVIRFSGNPKVNGIAVSRPSDGGIQILPPGPFSPASLIRLF